MWAPLPRHRGSHPGDQFEPWLQQQLRSLIASSSARKLLQTPNRACWAVSVQAACAELPSEQASERSCSGHREKGQRHGRAGHGPVGRGARRHREPRSPRCTEGQASGELPEDAPGRGDHTQRVSATPAAAGAAMSLMIFRVVAICSRRAASVPHADERGAEATRQGCF